MHVSRVRRPRWMVMGSVVVGLALLTASCGGDGAGDSEQASVRVIMGWIPSPQFGGFYAALEEGFYEEAGLDVQLDAGPVESPLQIVAAGTAQFGFGDGDELLQARSQNIPVVGVFPTFQTALRILVYHQENPLTGFEDLDGRVMYVDLGDAWWDFIVNTYGLQNVQEREYSGPAFLQDKTAVIQGYAGDELELAAADPSANLGVVRVADSGWNPYMQILFTTESYLEENPDVVRRFVEASVRGWEHYRENFAEVNEFIAEQEGSEAPVDVMNEVAEIYDPFIFEGGFPVEMATDRWEATLDALRSTGVLTQDVDVTAAFTNEYIP